jgi:hypothetical protein
MKTKHHKSARAKRHQRINPFAAFDLIQKHSEPPNALVVEIVAAVNECFNYLRNSGRDVNKFNIVASALNVSLVRAEKIDLLAEQTMNLGIAAMNNAAARKAKTGHYGFSGPEMIDMQNALDFYAQVFSLSTGAQMDDAIQECQRRMEEQAKAEGVTL